MLVKMFPNSFEAKQYILNELYHIDADKLAEDYQASFILSGDIKKKACCGIVTQNRRRK